MRRSLPLLYSTLIVTLAVTPMFARTRVVAPSPSNEIRIGGLFSLTGDGATLGIASQAALELAARDINQEMSDLRLPYHVITFVEDTKLTPTTASAKLEELESHGISIVIGPQSSSEAAAIRDEADTNGVLVISQGSTASSLAIADDNLFRLAPNDKLEGAAMVTLMRANGIDTLLPIWRDDAGNGGLHNSVSTSLTNAGGTMLPGFSYEPTTTDFSATVSALGNALRAARTASPSAHIAVYLASFEEAVAIFDLARLDPDLAGVRWYGGDGVTQSQAVLADPNAAAFAAATSFTAPNVGLDQKLRDRWQPISDQIRDRVGFVPDAYSLSVYDAAWVAALSAVEAQGRAEFLRPSFVRNVQRYWGITGPTALDANGDRKIASFDLWTVENIGGQLQWTLVGQE